MQQCPRCESEGCQILSESPVKGCWTMYLCPTCFYSWRSTEPEQATNPARYEKGFKIDPKTISSFPVVPAIFPRRV